MTQPERPSSPVLGVSLAAAGYLVFTFQDALVKWLVADYSVWQVLFARSVTIVVVCLAIGRLALVRRTLASHHKGPLLLRGAVILAAWLCYYTASRDLQLAELVTIYFAAPLVVTALSVWLLGERVGWTRWLGTAIGFIGVVIACQPGTVGLGLPVTLTLAAAVLWGYSSILVRQISAYETTPVQMLFSNSGFVIACGVTLPWTGSVPLPFDLLLMVGIGLMGAAAQYMVYEGFRLAQASLIAPFEYTSLIWAFVLSWLIWGDVPGVAVFAGAGLIVTSGLLMIITEWWSGRRSRPAGA